MIVGSLLGIAAFVMTLIQEQPDVGPIALVLSFSIIQILRFFIIYFIYYFLLLLRGIK